MKSKIIHWSLAMTLVITALPAAALAQSNAIPEFSAETEDYRQARLAAEVIIKKKYPFAVAEAVHVPNPINLYHPGEQRKEYAVHFVRHLNGIPYPENRISMVIDEKGRAVSEYIIWHKQAVLSERHAAITPDKAPKRYMEQAQLALSPLTPTLLYPSDVKFTAASLLDQLKLDAKSGELVETLGTQWEALRGSGKLVSDKPLPAPAAKPILTAGEAVEQAKKYITPPSSLTILEPALSKYSPSHSKSGPVWGIAWVDKNDIPNGNRIDVWIRQSTGELLTFVDQSKKGERLPKELTLDEARHLAREAIIKYSPQAAHLLSESHAATHGDNISFIYRAASGPGELDGGDVRVNINTAAGIVSNYEDHLTEQSAAARPGRSEAQLKAALLSAYDFRQIGVTVPPGTDVENLWKQQLAASGYKELITNTPVEVNLAYSPELKPSYRNLFLDAQDGTWKYQMDGATAGEKNRPTSYRP